MLEKGSGEGEGNERTKETRKGKWRALPLEWQYGKECPIWRGDKL